jgi:prefoldin subunit 5
MQVRLTTTIETIIDLGPGVTVEEARKEIFERYNEDEELEELIENVQARHSNAVVYDEIRATSVTHSFEEVK